jgi:phytoene dehydrogenase-like protein
MSDYDAVIIGSGIGGLTTGAYLAKRGRRVLICEQYRRPGGYLTSFKHKGYIFDGGTQSVEDMGMFIPMLRQLGLLERIPLSRSRFAIASEEFFCLIESIDDLGAFYDELIRLFPDERRGLSDIRDLAQRCCRLMNAVLAAAPNPVYQDLKGFLRENLPSLVRNAPAMRGIGEFNRLFDVPLKDYLSQRINNPDVVNIICNLGFYGMPVSFGLASSTFAMDLYYSMGGFQAVADTFVDFIEENGGEVRCKTMVEEIMVENKKAVGIRLKGGEVVRAPFVISNADMRQTFLKLLPPESVPAEYKERLRTSKVSHSMFTVFLGLDIPPQELDNRGCHHIVIFPELRGVDFAHISDDPDFYRHAPVMINIPTTHDPSLAPEGKSAMTIQYYATEDFADNWGTEDGKPTPRYKELKETIGDQMIATTEKVLPGISEYIDVKLTATPYTYKRYSLNSGGSIIGWSKHPAEALNSGFRSFMDFLTPVKNLYQVGHWAFGPGGIPGGAMTGKLVSDIVRLRSRLKI